MSFDKSFANNERLVFYPKFFRRFFGLLPAASILIGIGFLAEFMMVRSGDYYGSAKRGGRICNCRSFRFVGDLCHDMSNEPKTHDRSNSRLH